MAGATTVTGGTAAALTAAPAEHSLLTGLSPIANAATDHAKFVAYNSSLSPLTDGAYPGVNALVQPVRDESGALVNNNDSRPDYGIKNTAGALVTCFSCWTNDYIDLTFDLGESAPMTGFAVGNTAEPTPLQTGQTTACIGSGELKFRTEPSETGSYILYVVDRSAHPGQGWLNLDIRGE